MPAFNFNGIDFREGGESYESPEEAWGLGSQTITATYLVNWTDRQKARVSLLGTCTPGTRFYQGVTYGYLNRQLPHRYPDPLANWLYARSVPRIRGEGRPIGKDINGIMSYDLARMTCIYGELPYDLLENAAVENPAIGNAPDESLLLRYIFRQASESARILSFRHGSWRWTGTNDGNGKTRPVDGAVGIVLPITELDYTWYYVPFTLVPRATILAAVGRVNQSPFDGCDTGTLLVRPPVWEYTRLPDGTRAMNVHIKLAHNALDWNKYSDPERNNEFHDVSRQQFPGSPLLTSPYPSVDIPPLFRPQT